jgi:hypothetical protein
MYPSKLTHFLKFLLPHPLCSFIFIFVFFHVIMCTRLDFRLSLTTAKHIQGKEWKILDGLASLFRVDILMILFSLFEFCLVSPGIFLLVNILENLCLF